MPAEKTETLTVRLCPETKAVLRQIAEDERRSLANMLDIMILDYSRRHSGADPQPPLASSRARPR